MEWDDGTETWEKLSSLWDTYPITISEYGNTNTLLHLHGWKRFREYVGDNIYVNSIFREVELNNIKAIPTYKFGEKVPMNHSQEMIIDKVTTIYYGRNQRERN